MLAGKVNGGFALVLYFLQELHVDVKAVVEKQSCGFFVVGDDCFQKSLNVYEEFVTSWLRHLSKCAFLLFFKITSLQIRHLVLLR